MANYTSRANVILSVNGKQAQQVLSSLEKNARRLEKQMAAAASAGDKASMKKLQRELNQTNRLMDQLKGDAKSTEHVLSSLDKATPKELNKTLKQLKNELNGIERGTEAWDAHVEKIKAVKEEIRELNEEMNPDEGFWDKLNGYWEKFQLGITAAAAAVTGLVMAGKQAVNAYAEMEQEMANVQKFTGMDPDEIAELNEEFKKMDTRTSREELNQLAQEAGRLGKTSIEDVLGFVRAADKINVALDDLGDGATLTLSKLAGIFGDEDRLGTEKALLSVGSVINELSQNCSASAPYLAEFASRMGGVGAQAGLSVQQIMGFGAVLDSNNQALEASATALSQVIVRIYQDPAKYARVAGMDVQHFSNLVKTDMNAALIEFLSTLKQAGGMDVLSPMFKDMGENGSRAISALSTLANNIEDVKSQQIVANEAFEEATSIDKEFDVQNNTVQAGLDKAKTRVHELAVELGEKLQPVMRLAISSSTLALKALSATVNFLITYRREIVSVGIAIAAYTVYVKGSAMATAAWGVVCRVVQGIAATTRVVILALRIGYYQLTGQITRATAASRIFNTVCKASPIGIVIGLVTALVGVLVSYILRANEAKKAIEQARKEEQEWKKSLIDISEAAAQSAAAEERRVKSLYETAINQAKSTDERRKAAERLQQLYPDYFKNLSVEQIMVGQAKDQYDKLRVAIINAARARAAAAKIEENEKQLLTLEDQLEKEQQIQRTRHAEYIKAVNDKREAERVHRPAVNGAALGDFREMNSRETQGHVMALDKAAAAVRNADANLKAANANVNSTLRKMNYINDSNNYLAKKYQNAAGSSDSIQTPAFPIVPSGSGEGGTVSSSGGGGTAGFGGSGAQSDKFEAEKIWREQEEAMARIDYATGVSDFKKYTEEMDRIAVEFYEKQLLHTDISESERLQITADWREAQRKQQEDINAQTVEDEKKRYNSELAELKQFYIDGSISKETYDIKTEEAEIKHQNNIVGIIDKNIEKFQKAEDERYADELVSLIDAEEKGELTYDEYMERQEKLEIEHFNRLGNIESMYAEQKVNAQQQLTQLLLAQTEERQKKTKELEDKYAAMKNEYFGDNQQEAQAKYDADLALLDVVYQRELAAAGENAAERLRIEEAFEKAKLALKKKYGLLSEEDTRNAMEKAIGDSAAWLESDGGKALTGSLSTLTSGMSSIFSQLSSGIQAELEMQTAAINKRYDAEISRAEGNSYLVQKLEKEKEKEIAKAKSEANRKMFAMQVIQAVAQTAQNALNAYGSAAAIPVVGHVLAPIAAAMAIAAGTLQIANIKKQQQASEAQGYRSGGFTPKGKADEVAGVVHKGEWVASQRLVNNPRTRPLLEALDYAQRTNTIGAITAADVSRTITAPMVLASQPAAQPVVVQSAPPTVVVEQNGEYAATMRQLADRLNEPFVTVNTVSGDYGSEQAKRKYDKLMKNKSPKSRK